MLPAIAFGLLVNILGAQVSDSGPSFFFLFFLYHFYNKIMYLIFVCVEVLWPSQPNRVMLCAVSFT